jgi:hypothetical protein
VQCQAVEDVARLARVRKAETVEADAFAGQRARWPPAWRSPVLHRSRRWRSVRRAHGKTPASGTRSARSNTASRGCGC